MNSSAAWSACVLTRLAALAIPICLSACATRDPTVTPTAAPTSASRSDSVAPAEPVPATITRATPAFHEARTSAAASRCTASVGRTTAIRFEAGRYLIRLEASDTCAAQLANREAWVAADDVEIADSAYAPSLVRIENQPALRVAMAYTGNKIFCDTDARCRINEALYATPRCFANPEVASALRRAAQTLQARDPSLALKVLDCYRPVYVQERMFALVADPKWVAQPKGPRYGGHNRGVAIDLTLEKNGVEFDMGTAFDAFDEKSEWHDDGRGLTESQQRNRRMLRSLMIDVGFRPYDGEWWHFSLPFSPESEPKARNLPL